MKLASTIARTEQYFNILRGPVSHPVARLKYLDDNDVIQTITGEVISLTVDNDRDDERESGSLLIPPAGRMTVVMSNEQKQFTTGFGGTFDGLVRRGRRFFPELGHKIDGTDEFFAQGLFIADDPSFDVAPSAVLRITARDWFGLIADSEISLASDASILASDYIIKILERTGLKSSDHNIQLTTTTLLNTPTVDNENVAELLSEVLEFLQLEDDYRLVTRDNKITLEVLEQDALAADYTFHWVNHISAPYRRVDNTLKLLRRLTVVKAKPTVSVGLTQGTQSGKTEADLPFVHSFTDGPAIHVNWQQGGADTLEIVETNRTTSTITLDRRLPAATGSWSLSVFGDKVTSGTIGEDASGENIRLIRGKTKDVINRFVQNSAEAQQLAEKLGETLFSERVRAEFTIGTGWLLGEINDLLRVVEKYSNDKRLYYGVRFAHSYSSARARLDTRVITEFSGLVEVAQKYDLGFNYDTGRIYDERFDVGAIDQEDTSFRGAVRTVP